MITISKLLLVFCSMSAHAVVFGHDASRSLGPDDQKIRQVTVRFVYDSPDGKPITCTGVQIDPQTVLTAGHCLEPQTVTSLRRGRAFIEAYDETAPGKVRRIQVASVEGGDTASTDFAIVKTRGDLPGRQSVPLAYSGCDQDSRYVLAGFGITDKNETSDHLMTATFEAAHSMVASFRAGGFKPNSKRVFLTPDADARACMGDSGGPVFCLKHGMIAVRGVLNTVHASMGAQTMRPDIANNVYCRDWGNDISITTVADGMADIERLRGSMPMTSIGSGSAHTSAAAR